MSTSKELLELAKAKEKEEKTIEFNQRLEKAKELTINPILWHNSDKKGNITIQLIKYSNAVKTKGIVDTVRLEAEYLTLNFGNYIYTKGIHYMKGCEFLSPGQNSHSVFDIKPNQRNITLAQWKYVKRYVKRHTLAHANELIKMLNLVDKTLDDNTQFEIELGADSITETTEFEDQLDIPNEVITISPNYLSPDFIIKNRYLISKNSVLAAQKRIRQARQELDRDTDIVRIACNGDFSVDGRYLNDCAYSINEADKFINAVIEKYGIKF